MLRGVRYADYLQLEGTCSVVLGVALAGLGLTAVGTEHLWALAFVPATLLLLVWFGVRAGAPWSAPGRWLTERPLRSAGDGDALPAAPLRRRLLLETVVWIVAVAAWVFVTGESRALVFGTGLASVAFGLVQAVAARRRVERDAPALRVAQRPALGTPRLTRA